MLLEVKHLPMTLFTQGVDYLTIEKFAVLLIPPFMDFQILMNLNHSTSSSEQRVVLQPYGVSHICANE
jgi:hypothetical protein